MNIETPIDKMTSFGPSYLSSHELVSILTGCDESTARAVATIGLHEIGRYSYSQIVGMPGMTKRKAAILTAAIELGRRRATDNFKQKTVITSSTDAGNFLRHKYGQMETECFVVLYLNRSNRVLSEKIISIGGITGTVADPRIILKEALLLNAVSLIITHNHPSGSLKPSRADEEMTRKIKEAGKYHDITLQDHIITSEEGYYSFADEGLL